LLFSGFANGQPITEEKTVEWGGVTGKIIEGTETITGTEFSDATKSTTFIRTALANTTKCPICNGYLDVAKSVSYVHVDRKEDGGIGNPENCQLTHPFCNQGIKG